MRPSVLLILQSLYLIPQLGLELVRVCGNHQLFQEDYLKSFERVLAISLQGHCLLRQGHYQHLMELFLET